MESGETNSSSNYSVWHLIVTVRILFFGRVKVLEDQALASKQGGWPCAAGTKTKQVTPA